MLPRHGVDAVATVQQREEGELRRRRAGRSMHEGSLSLISSAAAHRMLCTG
eukprot:COSAG01_NODE_2794_length_7059_cov_28.564080_7_plen_51_part_00